MITKNADAYLEETQPAPARQGDQEWVRVKLEAWNLFWTTDAISAGTVAHEIHAYYQKREQFRRNQLVCGDSKLRTGCGLLILPDEVYRCADCGIPFHCECIKKHCAADIAAKAKRITELEAELARAVQQRGLVPK